MGWTFAVGSFLFILWVIKSVLVPFLVAFLLAYAFDPLIHRMERILSRPFSILLLFFGILLSLVLVLIYIVPIIQSEISVALQKFPHYLGLLKELVPAVENRFGIHIPRTFGETLDALLPKINEVSPKLFEPLTTFVVRVFSNTVVFIVWLVKLLIIPIAAYYFLKDFDRIKTGVANIVPTKFRSGFHDLVSEIDRALSGFIRGQLLVVLILSALYSLALLAVGVDLSVLLGIISGTIEIIPYLGFIVGMSISLLMTTLQYQDFLHPLLVLVLFSFIQTAQGLFISPKVIGQQVGIHPLVVIAAITIGGDLFGLVGVLLAIPCAAVLLVVLKAMVRAFKASSFFNVPPVGE